MICDLLNGQGATPRRFEELNQLECKLLYPVICAFRAKDKSWMHFLPQCHSWLFALIVGISRNRGWDVTDIYKGESPVAVIASGSKNEITLRMTVEGFQYSKMTFSKED